MSNTIEKQLRDMVEEYLKNMDSWISDGTVLIRKLSSFNTDRGLEIEVTAMYDRPSINLGFLKALSEFFQTDEIDTYDGTSWQGCDTCDYGSKYGVVIQVRNPKTNYWLSVDRKKYEL